MSADRHSTNDEKEPFPDELKEKGLTLLRDAAKGNGLAPEKIIETEFDGEVLQFNAFNIFKFTPVVAEKIITGRQKGQVVGSQDEARRNITQTINAISRDKKLRYYIEEELNKRKDKGFAVTNHAAPLKPYKTNYVLHNTCTSCSKTGKVTCPQCQGQKQMQCHDCHGQRRLNCPQCHGQGTLNTAQGQQPCTRCHGQRYLQCPGCHGHGMTACKTCHESGQITCTPCAGTGWTSHVFYLDFKNKSRFEYPKEELPPEVPPLIDALGPAFITSGHGQAVLITTPGHDEELNNLAKPDEMIIAYDVRLPWGQGEYQTGKDKTFTASLFGFLPEPVHVDPYLEDPTRLPRALLQKASQNPAKALENIQKAARCRLIRSTLIAAASLSPNKGKAYLSELYPFGIALETLETLYKQSDAALKNVTRKARFIGLAVGAVSNTLLYAAYFLGPGRAMITQVLNNASYMMGVDLALVVLGGLFSTATIQVSAKKSLQDALIKLLPPERRKKITPKSGQSAYWGYALGIGLYTLMLLAAIYSGKTAPEWWPFPL